MNCVHKECFYMRDHVKSVHCHQTVCNVCLYHRRNVLSVQIDIIFMTVNVTNVLSTAKGALQSILA